MRLILVLLLVSVSLRIWVIANTKVTARDSIGFIRSAYHLQHDRWSDVLRDTYHPPMYPMVVLAVSVPVCAYHGGCDALSMQLSAQIASALSAVLLVVPMFFLGTLLFDRATAFWSTLWFQVLPVASRAMSDGLTESVFLFILCTTLLVGVLALKRKSPWCWTVFGFLAGLAYLTRPEGLLLVAVGLIMILATFWVSAWRMRLNPSALSLGGMLTAAAVVAVPYMLLIGGLTNKPTGIFLIHQVTDAEEEPTSCATAVPLAAWSPDYVEGVVSRRNVWALKAVVFEINKTFHYLGPLCLLGVYVYRRRFQDMPGMCLLVVFMLFHALLLWFLASSKGYVSERHCLPIVLCGIFWSVAFVRDAVHAITARIPRLAHLKNLGALVTPIVLVLLIVLGLPSSLKPLHINRLGHRVVGEWLARNMHEADVVDDPFCWAEFYAGRVFTEAKDPPPGYHPTHYVVLDPLDRNHPRLPRYDETRDWAISNGHVVYYWPTQSLQAAQILVYAVPTQP